MTATSNGMGVDALKEMIDRVFSDACLERTLMNAAYGIKNWRFNLASLDARPAAGPFPAAGAAFQLGFEGSFDRLSANERKEIESYYDKKVSEISQEWRVRFPMAFGLHRNLQFGD
jgi:hypothetical protein